MAEAAKIIAMQEQEIRSLLDQVGCERAIAEARRESLESAMLRLLGFQTAATALAVFAQKVLGEHAVECDPETWGEYIAISGEELLGEIRKLIAVEVEVRTPKKIKRKRNRQRETMA